MSSIFWKKGSLIQRVGNHEANLGYIAFDPSTQTHVLWLKDPNEEEARYIRGDEFPSLAEAKDKAANSSFAQMFHYIWLSQRKGEDQNRPPGPRQSVHSCPPAALPACPTWFSSHLRAPASL